MFPPSPEPTTPFLLPIEPKPEANPMDVGDETVDHDEGEAVDTKDRMIDIPEFDAQPVEDDVKPIRDDPVPKAKHEADSLDDVVDAEQVEEMLS